jgi:NAD(P)H-dependent FMN reductase
MSPKILVFAGSARRGSLNKLLAAAAANRARAAGAEVTLLDLDDYSMPLYHGDLEAREGVPDAAKKLRKMFMEHHALMIATPENNASVPAMLKNTLDWISRPDSGQNGTVPYQNKVAALMAASPGALGGMRVLVHLRQILQALNVLVLSEQLAVPRAHELLEPPGVLKDVRLDASLRGLVDRLVDVTRRMNG